MKTSQDNSQLDYRSPVSSQLNSQSVSLHGPPVGRKELTNLGTDSGVNREFDPIKLPIDNEQVREALDAVRPYDTQCAELFRKHGYTALIDWTFKEIIKAKHPWAKKK